MNYAGNSFREREDKSFSDPPPKKALSSKVSSPVISRKKPLLDRLANLIFDDDATNVATYVFFDILIPAAKETIVDMVNSATEMLIFGENTGRRKILGGNVRHSKGQTIVNYNSIYDRQKTSNRYLDSDQRIRNSHKFSDIVFGNMRDADEVLSAMVDQIDTYGEVTVGDFYDLCDLTSEFTDQKYGWKNLNRAVVLRVRNGFIIELPKPILLE